MTKRETVAAAKTEAASTKPSADKSLKTFLSLFGWRENHQLVFAEKNEKLKHSTIQKCINHL